MGHPILDFVFGSGALWLALILVFVLVASGFVSQAWHKIMRRSSDSEIELYGDLPPRPKEHQ